MAFRRDGGMQIDEKPGFFSNLLGHAAISSFPIRKRSINQITAILGQRPAPEIFLAVRRCNQMEAL